jgi:hypothetical protein
LGAKAFSRIRWRTCLILLIVMARFWTRSDSRGYFSISSCFFYGIIGFSGKSYDSVDGFFVEGFLLGLDLEFLLSAGEGELDESLAFFLDKMQDQSGPFF